MDINSKIDYKYSPKFSRRDVEYALAYAVESVNITADEVGTEIYNKLLFERIHEYLEQV